MTLVRLKIYYFGQIGKLGRVDSIFKGPERFLFFFQIGQNFPFLRGNPVSKVPKTIWKELVWALNGGEVVEFGPELVIPVEINPQLGLGLAN